MRDCCCWLLNGKRREGSRAIRAGAAAARAKTKAKASCN
jgi:hypothetical protein